MVVRRIAPALALCLAFGVGRLVAAETPDLRFEAPPALAAVAERLEAVERSRLERVMALVGLRDAGPPIRVVLAAEGSAEAERVPDWVAGYAVGSIGLVVLLPSRSPAYPDRSLDAVLLHEVAHVLVARAAGRRNVPRWLDEGLAMAAGRYGLADRFELVFATMRRGDPSLASLDRSFPASPGASRRAYALSGAMVRWVIDTYGEDAVARMLAQVRAGAAFETAFAAVTGAPLAVGEDRFWQSIGSWRRFLPILTSPTLGWVAITLLFLLAYVVRRRRDGRQRAAWAAEDARASDEREAWRVEETPRDWVN